LYWRSSSLRWVRPRSSFDLKFQDQGDDVADTLNKRTCADIIRKTIPYTAVLIWKTAEDDQEAAAPGPDASA